MMPTQKEQGFRRVVRALRTGADKDAEIERLTRERDNELARVIELENAIMRHRDGYVETQSDRDNQDEDLWSVLDNQQPKDEGLK